MLSVLNLYMVIAIWFGCTAWDMTNSIYIWPTYPWQGFGIVAALVSATIYCSQRSRHEHNTKGVCVCVAADISMLLVPSTSAVDVARCISHDPVFKMVSCSV